MRIYGKQYINEVSNITSRIAEEKIIKRINKKEEEDSDDDDLNGWCYKKY